MIFKKPWWRVPTGGVSADEDHESVCGDAYNLLDHASMSISVDIDSADSVSVADTDGNDSESSILAGDWGIISDSVCGFHSDS